MCAARSSVPDPIGPPSATLPVMRRRARTLRTATTSVALAAVTSVALAAPAPATAKTYVPCSKGGGVSVTLKAKPRKCDFTYLHNPLALAGRAVGLEWKHWGRRVTRATRHRDRPARRAGRQLRPLPRAGEAVAAEELRRPLALHPGHDDRLGRPPHLVDPAGQLLSRRLARVGGRWLRPRAASARRSAATTSGRSQLQARRPPRRRPLPRSCGSPAPGSPRR